MKKIIVTAVIALLAGVALAQTYTRIPYLRVLNDAEVLGDLTVTGTCTGCGGGTPAGADGNIQYNNGGAFGGEAALNYDDTADELTLVHLETTGDVVVGDDIGITGDITASGVNITPAQGSSVLTAQNFSGCTNGTGNLDLYYQKSGTWVTLYIEIDCTANAASFAPGAIIPAAIRPTTGTLFGLPIIAIGTSAASNASYATMNILTTGALTFALQDGSSWDAAGTKGFWASVTYPVL